MISAWWLLAAFVVGVVVGMFAVGAIQQALYEWW